MPLAFLLNGKNSRHAPPPEILDRSNLVGSPRTLPASPCSHAAVSLRGRKRTPYSTRLVNSPAITTRTALTEGKIWPVERRDAAQLEPRDARDRAFFFVSVAGWRAPCAGAMQAVDLDGARAWQPWQPCYHKKEPRRERREKEREREKASSFLPLVESVPGDRSRGKTNAALKSQHDDGIGQHRRHRKRENAVTSRAHARRRGR